MISRARSRTVVFDVPSWLPGPDPPLRIQPDDEPRPPHPCINHEYKLCSIVRFVDVPLTEYGSQPRYVNIIGMLR
jgi:hypothetical protein